MDREPKPPRALKVYTRRKLTRGKKKLEEVSQPPRALKVYTRRKLTRGKKKPEEVSHVNEKLRTI